MISVLKDRLVFVTKIPCTDDFVQKSLCGEQLPAQRYQGLPDFAHSTVPFTCT